jgi:SPP1 family predicted phage head-tail adaptor
MKCCDLHAGMLREPITFERLTRVSDLAGGATETWATVSGAPTKAYVKMLSGGERYAAMRVEATTRWRIWCRYFAGLLERDRVIIRTRKHGIVVINNLELRDQWLEIDLDGGAAT